MSIPTSAITSMALALTFAVGDIPAEWTSILLSNDCRNP
jgi:hypothetical protein